MTSTTIKVSPQLRERLRRHAQVRNVTQAQVLDDALDLYARQEFFAQLQRDVAENPESDDERGAREAWLSGPLVADGGAE